MRPRRAEGVPPHWIKHNKASRWPHRWIVWDTESKWETVDKVTTHRFRLGVACWWDDSIKRDSEPTYGRFDNVSDLWAFISGRAKATGRTIAYAHNVGFDLQVSNMFAHLPGLGWELEWFNLERHSSLVAWRKGAASLVLTDSMTIFPVGLATVAGLVQDEKPPLPANDAPDDEWWNRCESDVRALTTAVRTFNGWAHDFDIGNWRPSGSGLAWSLWRHRFLTDDVLASSGPENAAAEREGMVTGRAEAWRTGENPAGGFYDWDMRRCYCAIATQVAVPVRYRLTVPRLSLEQYRAWSDGFAVLSRVTVTQDKPIVGVRDGSGFRWPVGTFTTMLWSPEIDLLLTEGADIRLGESRRYATAPALKAWGEWTLRELEPETATCPPVVGLWVKAQSRSLIGRFGMRYTGWAPHPDGNYIEGVGFSKEGGPGQPVRTLMHAAGKAWVEEPAADADDSVTCITGYVMSEARVRLWRALQAAGDGNVWHVDTDGLLVSAEGDRRMMEWAAANPSHGWVPKGTWETGEVRGTRNYTLGGKPHIAGVPWDAKPHGPDEWEGEMWQGLRQGLRDGALDRVTVRRATWRLTAPDSRRVHEEGGATRAYTPGEYDRTYPRKGKVT